MQFMLAAIPLFAALAAASPFAPSAAAGSGAAHANGDIKFPVPEDYTVKQAAAKCGNNAQLSCCNKVTYAGDTTTIDSGLLAGLLSDLIGSGSGSQGIGLFDECSKLDIPILINLQDLVNKKCQQNIACCQDTKADASGDLIGVALPCIALGALL
ncbi:hypothetical protein BDV29DRAFT_177909 [Aspergillus leporis]|uniref:Hydrophobin n=1 Tax=Aspergillus leporis TaxID=41062 RepID=A0A5N5WUB2_9EURO|nr:hypothetical protein BDV29DRAFT_177909 [Aspergillus leporis]